MLAPIPLKLGQGVDSSHSLSSREACRPWPSLAQLPMNPDFPYRAPGLPAVDYGSFGCRIDRHTLSSRSQTSDSTQGVGLTPPHLDP